MIITTKMRSINGEMNLAYKTVDYLTRHFEECDKERLDDYKAKHEALAKEKHKVYDKLEAIIAKAEGKARERTLTVDELFKALDEIDSYCAQLGTVKDLIGTKVEVNINAQTFPSAYKYTPMSTWFTVERKSSGWDLISVTRDICRATGYYFTWSQTFADHMASYTSRRTRL